MTFKAKITIGPKGAVDEDMISLETNLEGCDHRVDLGSDNDVREIKRACEEYLRDESLIQDVKLKEGNIPIDPTDKKLENRATIEEMYKNIGKTDDK